MKRLNAERAIDPTSWPTTADEYRWSDLKEASLGRETVLPSEKDAARMHKTER